MATVEGKHTFDAWLLGLIERELETEAPNLREKIAGPYADLDPHNGVQKALDEVCPETPDDQEDPPASQPVVR